MSKQPWYKNGLRFECTQCGACCTGSPGLVQFTTAEGKAMAEQVELDWEEFKARHTLPGEDDEHWELAEVKTEFGFDCVLLERCPETGKTWCTAHSARPIQCRTWPFWPTNIKDEETWKRVAKDCEGIGRGDTVPLKMIVRDRDRSPYWASL